MRYFVLASLCLIAVIAYVQRLGVQSANTSIERDFQINTAQFGTLGTMWLIGYAIMQIPSGWLADRIGSRTALTIYAIVWSVIAGSIGLCTSFEALLVVWFAMGMALAGVFPCAAKSIGSWFPDTEKAMASGLLGSFTMLGTAAASLITSRLLTQAQWSWQAIYVAYGLAGVVWAIAYFAFVPERHGALSIAPPMTGADWRRLVFSVPLRFLCGQQFFRAGAMIFFINWFPKFLKESREFSETDAGSYAAIVNICALVGGILGGFFSDWLLRRTGWRRLSRQGLAVAGMSACAILVMLTLLPIGDNLTIVIFSLGAFIATFGGVSGYTVAIEFGGTRTATVFSIMNMCGNFGAAIVNQAVGELKEATGSWNAAIWAIAAVCIIDAVCWALLNPKEPLFPHDHV